MKKESSNEQDETVEESASKKKDKPKALSATEIRDLINKKSGVNSAYLLTQSDNPTIIKGFIPSSSKLLNANMVDGEFHGGLGMGLIHQIVGPDSSGKSFLAVDFAKNAIDKGMTVIYMASEPGCVESEFLEKYIGKERMKNFVYVVVQWMEEIFERIEELLAHCTNELFFVWDSYAATPAKAETLGSFDPASSFAIAPRVANLGLRKLMVPIAKKNCTLLVLNQLRDAISSTPLKYLPETERFRIPGGRSLAHAFSTILFLFPHNSKAKAIMNEDQQKVGKGARLVIKKSRAGREGFEIPIEMTWSPIPHLHDEELWFDALKEQGVICKSNPGMKIKFKDGSEDRVKEEEWMDYLSDKNVYNKVLETLEWTFVNNYKKPASAKAINAIMEEDAEDL